MHHHFPHRRMMTCFLILALDAMGALVLLDVECLVISGACGRCSVIRHAFLLVTVILARIVKQTARLHKSYKICSTVAYVLV